MGVVGRKRVTWGSALALVLAVAGCQRAEQAGNPDAMRSLAVLGRAYGDYLASHRNVPPPDLAAFRTFATSQPAGAADYRIGDFDALLAAGRDG
ncbi:MAG TPA: hypothetical protein PJ982_09700, partial [Lacipirellulaceae bacterium]|nr:hypothetical protein [Lacipirellulaceae bacterium]